VEERAERIGRNEALFRHVNERLKEIGESFALVTETNDFVCECGNPDCAVTIRLTGAEYERIRSDPHLFFVVPGHEIAEVESVVEVREGYEVVRKHLGEPAALARETNPRA
jgi:hypothetical protein